MAEIIFNNRNNQLLLEKDNFFDVKYSRKRACALKLNTKNILYTHTRLESVVMA